jgi:hypothetical protein
MEGGGRAPHDRSDSGGEFVDKEVIPKPVSALRKAGGGLSQLAHSIYFRGLRRAGERRILCLRGIPGGLLLHRVHFRLRALRARRWPG